MGSRHATVYHRVQSDSETTPLSVHGIEETTTVSLKDKMSESPGLSQTASSNESVFNLINAVLGVGVLGFPYAFKTCGIGLAALLVLFIAWVTLFSAQLLLLSSQLTGKKSYEELAGHLYGRPGQLCINFCILVINLGAIVSYLNVLADVLSSVSGTIIPPALEPSRNSVLLGVTLLAVLPVSVFVQDAAGLAFVSICSVSIIFVFTLVMTLSAMRPSADITVVHYWESHGVFVSFPVIAYGFTIQTVIFPVYTLLRSATTSKMNEIVKKATWLCGLVYFLVGLGGYLTFGERTHGDILRNLGASDPLTGQTTRGAVEKLLKLAYGMSIVGTVPLVMLPSLSLLLPMFDPFLTSSRSMTRRLIAVGFIGVAYACAVLIPNVEFILGLNGGTSSVMISYIMPALLYLRASANTQEAAVFKTSTKADDWLKWKARGLLLLGITLGILCTSATLRAVHNEQEVVSLVQNIVDKSKALEEKEAVGRKTIHTVKAVNAVESAHREIGDVKGDTVETLGALHKTAKTFNTTLEQADKRTPGFFQIPLMKDGVRQKQAIEAYKNVLEVIESVILKIQTTLEKVEMLQEKLRALSEEIKQERQNLGSEDSTNEVVNTEGKVDSLVKDLTTVLGISVERDPGAAEETLDVIHDEFKTAIAALKDTLQILNQVKKVLNRAIEKGTVEGNVKDIVSTAMEKAIHATGHSALALELTSNALSEAATNQKSELAKLLSTMVKDAEKETTVAPEVPDDEPKKDSGNHQQPTDSKKKRKKDESIEKISKMVTKDGGLDQSESINTTVVKETVAAVIDEAAGDKKEAVEKAQQAVDNADPGSATKPRQGTDKISTIPSWKERKNKRRVTRPSDNQ